MARKKTNAKSDPGSSLQLASTTATKTPGVIFPDFAVKVDLECQTVLEDQILVIENFLSAAECKDFVKFIDGLPLELTPPKKRGEADRVNQRFSVLSTDFANKLYDRLNPHLPNPLPCPPSIKRRAAADDSEVLRPHSCNSNIRVYKYAQTQYFGPHYDDSVRDPVTGAKSEWTILIYLTGIEDGVEGGQTLFYKEEKGKASETISPPLKRGSALLHRHGQECMLHEGSPVKTLKLESENGKLQLTMSRKLEFATFNVHGRCGHNCLTLHLSSLFSHFCQFKETTTRALRLFTMDTVSSFGPLGNYLKSFKMMSDAVKPIKVGFPKTNELATTVSTGSNLRTRDSKCPTASRSLHIKVQLDSLTNSMSKRTSVLRVLLAPQMNASI